MTHTNKISECFQKAETHYNNALIVTSEILNNKRLLYDCEIVENLHILGNEQTTEALFLLFSRGNN